MCYEYKTTENEQFYISGQEREDVEKQIRTEKENPQCYWTNRREQLT